MTARRWDRHSRKHWHALTAAEKKQAVLNLVDGGFHEYSVSAACGLSIEQIRRIVAERGEAGE